MEGEALVVRKGKVVDRVAQTVCVAVHGVPGHGLNAVVMVGLGTGLVEADGGDAKTDETSVSEGAACSCARSAG